MIKRFSFLLVFCYQISFSQRIVLIEQFTNAGCPPCAAYTPQILNYVDNNLTDVVAIAYHTYFPYNDSMYFENPVESTSRVNYYGISSVPYSIVDGNYYSNTSSNFSGVIASTINARKAITNNYSIANIASYFNSNNLIAKIAFESLAASNASDSLFAYVAVIEKNVLKSSYAGSPGANAETNYEYVMRKMLPNQNGTFLIHRNLNGKDTLSFNWPLQKIKNYAEVRIVAFVQNKTTKEVYMANMFSINSATGITNLNKNNLSLNIYPNPTKSNLTITAYNLKTAVTIKIIDVLGKTIYIEELSNEALQVNTSDFQKGVYFVLANDNEATITKKIIVE